MEPNRKQTHRNQQRLADFFNKNNKIFRRNEKQIQFPQKHKTKNFNFRNNNETLFTQNQTKRNRAFIHIRKSSFDKRKFRPRHQFRHRKTSNKKLQHFPRRKQPKPNRIAMHHHNQLELRDLHFFAADFGQKIRRANFNRKFRQR